MAENGQMVLIREVLIESDPNRGNMVILKERPEDERFFLMFVGDSEFTAIAKEKGLVEPKRPLTHDLYLSILQRLQIEFLRVEAMGADFAYLGTRFIATQESMATADYKQMLLDCTAKDIVYTPAITGTNANFLWPSLEKAGYTREMLGSTDAKEDFGSGAKAWRDTWSAGHGVATIHDIPSAAELVARLAAGYRAACALPVSPALG